MGSFRWRANRASGNTQTAAELLTPSARMAGLPVGTASTGHPSPRSTRGEGRMRALRVKVGRLGAIGAATLIGVAGLGAAGLVASTPASAATVQQYFAFDGPTGWTAVNTAADWSASAASVPTGSTTDHHVLPDRGLGGLHGPGEDGQLPREHAGALPAVWDAGGPAVRCRWDARPPRRHRHADGER
jgi:hypothetical protein